MATRHIVTMIGVAIAAIALSASLPGPVAQVRSRPSVLVSDIAPRADSAAALAPADRRRSDGRTAPAAPDDATAAKAYAVFDQACAQCHQAGRLKGPAAGGGFSNILALDEIANDPALVRPGLPDASRVYDVLLRRHAPLVLASPAVSTAAKDGSREKDKDPATRDGAERSWPSGMDIQAVRDWIDRLPRTARRAACADRPPVTPDQIGIEITRIVTETPMDRQPGTRFLSLANLHNACVGDAEIESYRQAVAFLLNSLSWAERPQAIRASGPGNVLITFNLRDLMWVPAHWQRLATLYPHATAVDAALDAAVFKLVETEVPVLRADWFVTAAGTAPLYYDLIGMPNRMGDLEFILNVNSTNLVLRGAAVRAGVALSQITGGSRMVERLPARTGSLWRAYDIDDRRTGESVLTAPVGPEPVGAIDRVFKPTGSRVLFSSPSGFMMFGQFGANGDRMSGRAGDGREIAGMTAASPHSGMALSCIGCHMHGPVGVRDDVRALALKDTTSGPVRDAIVMLHPDQASIDGLIAEDRERVATAIADAGVDASRTVNGQTPLAALVARYRAGGDIETIEIETGKTRGDVWAALANGAEDAKEFVLRAHAGPIGRAEMNRVLGAVTAHASNLAPVTTSSLAGGQAASPAVDPEQSAPAAATVGRLPAIDLTLWPSSPEFKIGDLAAFVARASSDCYLTLVGVDNRGIATVLYPNDFEPDNRLPAGKRVKIPSDAAGYRFRLKEAGSEFVVGLCTAQARTFAGIEHDFERQRFTVLGNWNVFIADQLAVVEKQEAEPPAKARPKGRDKDKEKDKDKSEKVELPTIASNHGRAAIRYEIRP